MCINALAAKGQRCLNGLRGLVLTALCGVATVWAQADLPVLSSPLPPGKGKAVAPATPASGAASSPSAGPLAGLPQGSGAGYHSPQSPIAPLPQRNDVVPWSVLSDIDKKVTNNTVLPVFKPAQKGLQGKVQRIQGFMVPLDTKATQTHFLLTSVPMTCSFCLPGGPESIVEVKARKPVRYSVEPVVVEGRFTTLTNDPYGLYYRVTEAVPVQ
jgi:hypothetical protein